VPGHTRRDGVAASHHLPRTNLIYAIVVVAAAVAAAAPPASAQPVAVASIAAQTAAAAGCSATTGPPLGEVQPDVLLVI
jgi:hypothetical protein